MGKMVSVKTDCNVLHLLIISWSFVQPVFSDSYMENFYHISTRDTSSRKISSDATCIDATDIYQSLSFQANWTKSKLYWKSTDFDFEARYLREQTCFDRSACQLPYIQVIVVPFSHNDPGWLKTYESYFDTKTRLILDNAMKKLTVHKNMTFVWSEISFLSKWWHTTANTMQKRIMKRLLDEGRFEILTGGWVMSDEASPSLFALSNQLIEGHNWLKRNLNYKPIAAWSIDPFGHGSVMPYLLKISGINRMMIQRLHYAWKHWLAEHKYGDFLWNQIWDNNGDHNIHCLNAPYDLYPTKHSCGPNPEECMRFNFRDIPGHGNEEHLAYMKPVTEDNILDLADRLMGQYRRTASLTRHNIVVTGLGNDFEFSEAIEWDQQYNNYQKLFHFINSNPQRYNAKVRFGTLSQYFAALKNTTVPIPKFRGDFFPYSDVYFPYPPAYWVGYYSTRPFWKKLSRETEDELRKAEILFTFTLNFLRQNNSTEDAELLGQRFTLLVQARRWVALFQHHDGITGTSPRPTMVDYAKKLFDAIRFTKYIQSASTKLLIQRQTSTSFSGILESFTNLADQMPLKIPQQTTVKKIVLFNSIGWRRSHLVRIPIIGTTDDIQVFDESGNLVQAQVNPKVEVTDKGEPGLSAKYSELVFIAYLPPFSLTTYEIRRVGKQMQKGDEQGVHAATVHCKNCPYKVANIEYPYVQLSNKDVEAIVDTNNGFVHTITRKLDRVAAMVEVSLGTYDALFGSGAYLSRPRTDNPIDIMKDCRQDNSSQLYFVSGPVIQEITVICKEVMMSTYILQQGYPESLAAIYITNSVKPSSSGQNNGEFFMRFQTDLNTNEDSTYKKLEEPVFYTDNGLTVQKRMRVSRLPYEGNMYPTVNYAFIQDTNSNRRISVLIDRAHGFTSSKSGHLETIFDRRIPYDDARGMDEGVNDPEETVSNYILLLEHLPSEVLSNKDKNWMPSLTAQRLSKFLNYQPSVFVYDEKWQAENFPTSQPPITLFSTEFPDDVFLLNFRTSCGASRNVPGRKALMLLQNLGHFPGSNLSIMLGSNLKLNHFSESTDLSGDPKSHEQQASDQYDVITAILKVGSPFELTPYLISF